MKFYIPTCPNPTARRACPDTQSRSIAPPLREVAGARPGYQQFRGARGVVIRNPKIPLAWKFSFKLKNECCNKKAGIVYDHEFPLNKRITQECILLVLVLEICGSERQKTAINSSDCMELKGSIRRDRLWRSLDASKAFPVAGRQAAYSGYSRFIAGILFRRLHSASRLLQ
ncbi:hypothetical protein Hypma_014485 [Hypsizygus marmoreus]|uniref:Uncharacterized protein n=1 Tax=Hypsizygus marmoreus TaxID=39966 RepID=A0A369JEP4_HYPMA|nr:hypothetical protein Hypma_014485 [Hypsizygus marmoreus]